MESRLLEVCGWDTPPGWIYLPVPLPALETGKALRLLIHHYLSVICGLVSDCARHCTPGTSNPLREERLKKTVVLTTLERLCSTYVACGAGSSVVVDGISRLGSTGAVG